MMSRVGIRFTLEAAAILVTAVIAGPVLHLVWWEVGVAVFAVLGIGIFVESSLAAPEPAPKPAGAVQLPPVIEESPRVRVIHERPISALVPDAIPEPAPLPEPEPEPAPAPAPVAVAAPLTRVAGPPYSVWELERALGESGNADDEKTFLLHYLRDYASSDGVLPAEFEDLVRESFADLL